MTIPIDLPAGQLIPFLEGNAIQAGVEEFTPGGFRGTVLVSRAKGDTGDEIVAIYRCTKIFENRELALQDAAAVIAQTK